MSLTFTMRGSVNILFSAECVCVCVYYHVFIIDACCTVMYAIQKFMMKAFMQIMFLY